MVGHHHWQTKDAKQFKAVRVRARGGEVDAAASAQCRSPNPSSMGREDTDERPL